MRDSISGGSVHPHIRQIHTMQVQTLTRTNLDFPLNLRNTLKGAFLSFFFSSEENVK